MRKKILIIVSILIVLPVIYFVYLYFQAKNIHPIKMLEMNPLLAIRPHQKPLLEQITSSLDKITVTISGIVGLALLIKEWHTTKPKRREARAAKKTVHTAK